MAASESDIKIAKTDIALYEGSNLAVQIYQVYITPNDMADCAEAAGVSTEYMTKAANYADRTAWLQMSAKEAKGIKGDLQGVEGAFGSEATLAKQLSQLTGDKYDARGEMEDYADISVKYPNHSKDPAVAKQMKAELEQAAKKSADVYSNVQDKLDKAVALTGKDNEPMRNALIAAAVKDLEDAGTFKKQEKPKENAQEKPQAMNLTAPTIDGQQVPQASQIAILG